MSTARAGSSWNRSEVSSERINPSFDGTSATSLISCVCTDILTTLVSGTTTLTPGVRTEDDTLPKKSLTPTLPAGTVRKGPAARNRMNTSTATTTRPMRDGDGIGTGSRGIL